MAEVSEGFSFKYVRVCGLAKAKFDRSKLGATGTSMRDVSDCVVTGSCAECGKRKGNSDEVCRIPQKAFEDSKECVNMQQPYAAGGNSIRVGAGREVMPLGGVPEAVLLRLGRRRLGCL